MYISVTPKADVACKDLIGEAYEAAYKEYPGFTGFSGLSVLWDKVEETLKYDLSTSGDEDNKAMDILEEVFEEACRTAKEDYQYPMEAPEYVDYKKLWERICAVIGVRT